MGNFCYSVSSSSNLYFLRFRVTPLNLFFLLSIFCHWNKFLTIFLSSLTAVCHDEASRFLRIVTRGTKRSYIIPEDLIPLVQDVVNTHPGLAFLKQAPEFHSRYVHTVSITQYFSLIVDPSESSM